MAIRVPGLRSRHGRLKSSKRSAVAVLQLTAMVDMFTVMVVFLLQNYATTNQVLPISDKVNLPSAMEVKELKPSNVVVISEEGISFNNEIVATIEDLKSAEDWLLPKLEKPIREVIRLGTEKKNSIGEKIRSAVNEAKTGPKQEEEIDDFLKLTIQADKTVDFLSVKKIMYTVTEAGIQEINFAVLKKPEDSAIN
ncbi:MAG TPA: adventurous gliding motility protein S [Bdellovibrionales bacterium]|nr:adventurous gliding motility protein S [Pseudobdellovibrionaceae bacterium]HAG90903.1 adventurous gliding motility protein S [Bdellovibrionales bacterium]